MTNVARWVLALAVLCGGGFSLAARAGSADGDAQELLKITGIRGGLCLVVGAAARSDLYVQVLQPDARLAARWGAEFAGSECREREKLGIRNAAFDPQHYGSDLFNLILIEDPPSLGKANLADLDRILVPDGVVALRSGPASLASSARALDMAAVAAPPFAAAFRKAVKERAFKPCDNVKWRAGARAHWSSGWSNHGAADGAFYYTERLEVAGDPKGGQFLLCVRDAYNGRLLWTLEGGRVLAGTRDGRLFLNTSGKLVICDARTGAVQHELPPDGFEKGVRYGLAGGDNVAILGGSGPLRAFSSDGEKLWEGKGGFSYALGANRLFVFDYSLRALDLKDGKELWKSPLPRSDGYALHLSDRYVHAVARGGAITTFEQETGKEVWRYASAVPKNWTSWVVVIGDKVYAMRYCPYHKEDSDLFITTLDSATGRVESRDVGVKRKNAYNMCAPVVRRAGEYIVYFFNIWVDPKTMNSVFPYLAHPSCGFGTYMANGMAYNFPSRKFGPLQGISASAPADLVFDHQAGGRIFQRYSDAPAGGAAAKDADWVMFRATPSRSNATRAEPGDKLAEVWEVSLGVGGNGYGRMNSVRSGLTQAVSAYGLALAADMEGQRIVALDVRTGREKWVFPVGSRVEFSPTLYKGLCLFAAKDGFVYCLDAATGAPCWRRMIPPQARLIGGQDKLESLWSVTSDVMIENGIGYACAGLNAALLGGVRAIAFRPETGELVWGQCYCEAGTAGLFVGTGNPKKVFMYQSVLDAGTGKRLGERPWWESGCLAANNPMDDYLAGGVSLQRNGEDRMGVLLSNGVIQGKTIAFDDGLSVAFMGGISMEQWEKGFLSFFAKRKPGKENLWEIKDDLIIDDIVVTPSFVYAVGHHYREAKPPELRVVSRENGKTLAAHELHTALPAWNGMSVAGDKVFIATGEGKLICYQGTK